MKVAIFSPALQAVSGVSTHVNMLLGSRLANDFELLHFQVGSEGRSEGKLQRLMRFVSSPFQLAFFLISRRVNVVHVNTSVNRNAFWRDVVYLLTAKLLRRTVVNQFHSGFGPQKLVDGGFAAWAMRRFLLGSDVVVVLCSSALQEHKAFEPRVAIQVVPNAIEASGLLAGTRTANMNQALNLVSIGRLVKTKGLVETITAMDVLKKQGVRFQLRVAGSGSDEAEIRALVARLHLENEVDFIGPVFGPAKDQLLLQADVLVFPTYFEGMPYALLEAMAAGCVPVTCPVGGIPDVMADAVHGYLVPTHDAAAVANAIARLDANRAQLARMSEAGRVRIAQAYTVDRLADRFAQVYRRVGMQ